MRAELIDIKKRNASVSVKSVSTAVDREEDHSGEADTSSIRWGWPPSEPVMEIKVTKSLRFKLTVLFLCLITVVAATDAVIVASCLAAIAKELSCTSIQAFWIGTSFLLTQTVTIPIHGSISEIFGRKWTIIPAIGLFLLGSILCATAKNVNWLIAARCVQGIGAGGVAQLVQVILSDITTMEERPLYIAMAMGSWAIGSNIGIPLGGVIGAYTTWRWIFWINVPICIICILGLAFSLNLKKDTSSFATKLARMDWLGLGVFTSACTLFLAGVTSGGISHPWNSAPIVIPTSVGALLFLFFIMIEWKVAKEPMMPLRIFKDRTAVSGYATSFFQGLVLWCYIYYLIVFFLGAMQHKLLHSSLEILSMGAFVTPAAVVSSLLVKRTKKFKYIVIFGWVILAVGLGLNQTMHPTSTKAILYGPRCIAAIGAGLLAPLPLFAVQARQLPNDVGIATSTQVFARSLGNTFGVALGGTIFQNRWATLITTISTPLDGYFIPSNLAEVAYDLIAAFPADVKWTYRWLYSDSMDAIWWFLMAVSLVGLLFSLLARNEVLGGGLSGNQNFEDEGTACELEKGIPPQTMPAGAGPTVV